MSMSSDFVLKQFKTILSTIGLIGFLINLFFFFNPNYVKMFKPELSPFLEDRSQMFIGKWQGQSPTQDGGTRVWIEDFLPDGSHKIEFSIFNESGDKIDYQIEEGFWGVSGPVFFTITRKIQYPTRILQITEANSYYHDAYKIDQHTENTINYTSLETGNTYQIQRIDKP